MLFRNSNQIDIGELMNGTASVDEVQPAAPLNCSVSLALGGGVARGWSHIGVLRAFDEAGIPVNMIAGTSIGALVGGCYLAGKLDELEDFATRMTRRRMVGLLDISLRGSGLISGMRIAERMKEHLGDVSFDDLSHPLWCVATEIKTGHEIWLNDGPLLNAIRASYALPGIFEPVTHGDRILVDGALVNPVPVSICRAQGSPMVVAVNLNSNINGRALVIRNKKKHFQTMPETDELNGQPDTNGRSVRSSYLRYFLGGGGAKPSVTSVMVESFNIIQDRIARSRMAGDPPDLTIAPDVGHIGLAEFHRAAEAIEIGYETAMARVEDIRCLTEALSA